MGFNLAFKGLKQIGGPGSVDELVDPCYVQMAAPTRDGSTGDALDLPSP